MAGPSKQDRFGDPNYEERNVTDSEVHNILEKYNDVIAISNLTNKTNVVLISAPYWGKDIRINERIFNFNLSVFQKVVKGNAFIRYLDINNFISSDNLPSHGFHLRFSGKQRLANEISKEIINFVNGQSNKLKENLSKTDFINKSNLTIIIPTEVEVTTKLAEKLNTLDVNYDKIGPDTEYNLMLNEPCNNESTKNLSQEERTFFRK
ncbi:hypothetical protein FQR65_LT13547 [Abscondita terminalis]|nr:hypothetical protein FQR65_LT13547 [Abscondita terminalis]